MSTGMNADHGRMVSDFRRAAQVVRARGLAKCTYVTRGGEHCTVGALRVAHSGTTVDFNKARLAAELVTLSELLGRPMQPCGCGTATCCADEVGIAPFDVVTRWNDAEERTADEVIGLLEQAAEKLEADL